MQRVAFSHRPKGSRVGGGFCRLTVCDFQDENADRRGCRERLSPRTKYES
jgi:hypothetical protein